MATGSGRRAGPEVAAEFSLFLPSGTVMVLPIRSASDTVIEIELQSESRPIDAAVAPPHMWRPFRVQGPGKRLALREGQLPRHQSAKL